MSVLALGAAARLLAEDGDDLSLSSWANNTWKTHHGTFQFSVDPDRKDVYTSYVPSSGGDPMRGKFRDFTGAKTWIGNIHHEQTVRVRRSVKPQDAANREVSEGINLFMGGKYSRSTRHPGDIENWEDVGPPDHELSARFRARPTKEDPEASDIHLYKFEHPHGSYHVVSRAVPSIADHFARLYPRGEGEPPPEGDTDYDSIPDRRFFLLHQDKETGAKTEISGPHVDLGDEILSDAMEHFKGATSKQFVKGWRERGGRESRALDYHGTPAEPEEKTTSREG